MSSPMSKKDTFTSTIAGMRYDGEIVHGQDDFMMGGNDAISTLSGLIIEARKIITNEKDAEIQLFMEDFENIMDLCRNKPEVLAYLKPELKKLYDLAKEDRSVNLTDSNSIAQPPSLLDDLSTDDRNIAEQLLMRIKSVDRSQSTSQRFVGFEIDGQTIYDDTYPDRPFVFNNTKAWGQPLNATGNPFDYKSLDDMAITFACYLVFHPDFMKKTLSHIESINAVESANAVELDHDDSGMSIG